MKVALLTTDAREHKREYWKKEPYFGTAPEALIEGFKELRGDIELHVISCLQKRPVASPGKLGDNVYFHPLHVPKIGWMRTGYQGCVRSVRRIISELQPDIVHGQGTERDCGISAVLSGRPNVLTIHGNMAAIAEFLGARPLSFYWLAARLERFSLARTAGVICISRYTQNAVSPFARRTWLLPNAVHPSYFGVARRPVTPPSVVCVANIDERKNQIQLMRALDPLHAETGLSLTFAGAANAGSAYFRNFREEIAKRSWCSHAGSLDRRGVQALLSSATLAVLPSLEDNCPMVVLEAAAAGVPIAASRVGGIPDLIEHGTTGLMFEPSDTRSILAAVRQVVENDTEAARIAATAKATAKTRFDPGVVAKSHLEIYNEVLSSQ